MAKDDATPETVDAKPSKTSPQYARSLRNIMLLDRVLAERNKRYEAELKAFLKEKKRLHPDLSGPDKEKLEEHFTRNFYGPEYDAMAEFSKLDEKRLPLLEKEAELAKSGKSLSKPEKEQLTLLNVQVELGPEAYATQRLFDADTVKKFKRDYPEIEKELSAEIKAVASEGFESVNPKTRHMPATVALFNKKYPGLESELGKLKSSKDKSTSMLGACAMGMLKAGSVMLNPTGFFVSQAVAGILKTKTFSPLREKAAVGISRVVNKTGLGDWFKRQCAKVPKDTLKKVTVGASLAASVTLIGLGVVEAEDVLKLKESALAFVDGIDFAPVTEGFDNAMDATRDFFSEPEQVMASPAPDSELTFLDGVSQKIGGVVDSASETMSETIDAVQDYFADSGPGPTDAELAANTDPVPENTDGILDTVSQKIGDAVDSVKEQFATSGPGPTDAELATNTDPEIDTDLDPNGEEYMFADLQNKVGGMFDDIQDFFVEPEGVAASPDPTKQISLIDSLAAEPEIPDAPVEPETPDVPVEPETPDVPVEPETPDVPVEPEVPEVVNDASPADVVQALSASDAELFPNSYTVEPGDTLSEIVEERLQAAGVPYNYDLISDYVELVSANSGISDPNVIMAGQEIDLGSLPQPTEVMSPEQLQDAKNGIDADPYMNTYSPELIDALNTSPELNNGQMFTINYQPEQVIAPHVDVEQERSFSPRRMA